MGYTLLGEEPEVPDIKVIRPTCGKRCKEGGIGTAVKRRGQLPTGGPAPRPLAGVGTIENGYPDLGNWNQLKPHDPLLAM